MRQRDLFAAHSPRFQWTTCESLETVPGSHWPATPQHRRCLLEVKPNLCRHRSRCHVVRSGEGGQEVVERDLVGDVDGCDLKAPLVFLTAEKVVIADRDVEEMAGSDALGIAVVILCPRSRNRNQSRSVLRRRA